MAIVLDCETEAIQGNPIANPPALCGVAYLMDGHPPGYLHFRGPESNTKYSIVGDFIRNIWNSNEELIFHNAPFDLAVLMNAFPDLHLEMPRWDRIHDTLFLCYLADPYAQSLSLKPSADRYLDLPAEEQDELHDWIVRNVSGATAKTAGAYISEAPFPLIEKYAIGDVVRTKGLYDHLINQVPREAYDRERQLMPYLFASSQRGLRVARGPLEAAAGRAQSALDVANARIGAKLGVANPDGLTPSELAEALQRAGKMDKVIHTPTGKVSTAKKNLMACISDKELVDLLAYKSSLSTCFSTFMLPWLELSAEHGRLFPEWNQVRTTENGKRYGTRTGRLSCSNPNLMNVPTEFEQDIPPDLPPLPFMREFLLPEEGHVWLKRDFSSQEVRIAGHFEDGPLCRAYNENPRLDPHSMAHGMILSTTGKDYPRKHVKITGFQILYGGGAPAISQGVGCSLEEAALLKTSYFQAMPGLYQLIQDVTALGRSGQPITTWGGRKYYTEKSAKFPSRDFSYKLTNYLIQGSAADQTKQCIIDWETAQSDAVFLATVHDELNISAPVDNWKEHMAFLREVMNRDRLDVPMLSEGFVGENWHDIEETE